MSSVRSGSTNHPAARTSPAAAVVAPSPSSVQSSSGDTGPGVGRKLHAPGNPKKRKAPLQLITPHSDGSEGGNGGQFEERKQEELDSAKLNLEDAKLNEDKEEVVEAKELAAAVATNGVRKLLSSSQADSLAPTAGSSSGERPSKRRKVILACAGAAIVTAAAAAGNLCHSRGGAGVATPPNVEPRIPLAQSILRLGGELLAGSSSQAKSTTGVDLSAAASTKPLVLDGTSKASKGVDFTGWDITFLSEVVSAATVSKRTSGAPAAAKPLSVASSTPPLPPKRLRWSVLLKPFAANRDALAAAEEGGSPKTLLRLPGSNDRRANAPPRQAGGQMERFWVGQLRRAAAYAVEGAADAISGASPASQLRG